MNLKELEKIVDLCRKKGVDTIEFPMDGQTIKLTMGTPPPKRIYTKKTEAKGEQIPTAEQLLNWLVV